MKNIFLYIGAYFALTQLCFAQETEFAPTRAPFEPFAMTYTHLQWGLHCEVGDMCVYNISIPVNSKADFANSQTELDADSKVKLPTIETELKESEDELNATIFDTIKTVEAISESINDANVILNELNEKVSKFSEEVQKLNEQKSLLKKTIDELLKDTCYSQCAAETTIAPKLPTNEGNSEYPNTAEPIIASSGMAADVTLPTPISEGAEVVTLQMPTSEGAEDVKDATPSITYGTAVSN